MSGTKPWVDHLFHDFIGPTIFNRARSVEKPVWIGIGGQPGAGKTEARSDAVRLHGDAPLTAIIGDALRGFHPAYDELLRNDLLAMPTVTQPAVNRWVELSLEHAAERNYSVLVEGTFRQPHVTLNTAKRFHDRGYHTHLVGVAVPAWETRLSIVERFKADHAQDRQARWTTPQAHDDGLRGTPLTLSQAATSESVDRITVIERGGRVLFNALRPQSLSQAAHTIAAAQRRPPTADEHARWMERSVAATQYLAREMPGTPEASEAIAMLNAEAQRLTVQRQVAEPLAIEPDYQQDLARQGTS